MRTVKTLKSFLLASALMGSAVLSCMAVGADDHVTPAGTAKARTPISFLLNYRCGACHTCI